MTGKLLTCPEPPCDALALARDVGLDAVLTSRLARSGKAGGTLDVQVKATADGTVLAAFTDTAQTDRELYALLRTGAKEVAAELYKKLERGPVPQKPEPLPPEPEEPLPTEPGLVLVVSGAAAAIGGAVCIFVANGQLADVAAGGPKTYPAAKAQAEGAHTLNTVGFVVTGVGIAAAVAGIGYAVAASRHNARLDVAVNLVPAPGGLALVGTFP